MRREDAVPLTEEEMERLNYVHQIIRYIMECASRGRNVYAEHGGERLYACDNYSYDEYYLLAMGIMPKDYQCLNDLIYQNGRTHKDMVELSKLTTQIMEYLENMYKPIRDELRNGQPSKGRK